MGWRTVLINERCKLELQMNYLVVKKEHKKRVYIPEIKLLIVESTAVALTAMLLIELVKNNVKVLFCDGKHNPYIETVSIYPKVNTTEIIMKQIKWSKDKKEKVWNHLLRKKLHNQSSVLRKYNMSAYLKIDEYNNIHLLKKKIKIEGIASKIYFQDLFGKGFRRKRGYEKNRINMNTYLNYAYMVFLAVINREIVKMGYLTQIGLNHKNMYNNYNLSCDIIEPIRPIIDSKIYASHNKFSNSNFKDNIVSMLDEIVLVNKERRRFSDAITIYVRTVIEALNNKMDIEDINFIYEL